MNNNHPSVRRLTLTWVILIALTAISMISGRAGPGPQDLSPLGLWAVAILMAVTVFKAVQILRIYLNLRISTAAWKTTFNVMLAAITLVIFAAYWIGLLV